MSEFLTFSNGLKVPMVGLGTWRAGETVTEAVKTAIDVGYRHFDGAYFYQNEDKVGTALKEKIDEGKVSRSDLFITSKSWVTFRTGERTVTGFHKSLKAFGLDYLDLYLIHVPFSMKQTDEEIFPLNSDGTAHIDDDIDYLETWKGMEELVKSGLVKSIGVSNFSLNQLKRILDNCEIKPVTNQIECHPYFNQEDLVKGCQELGVSVTAYSPLATPERLPGMTETPQLLSNEVLVDIAKKYNKSAAQIALRYQLERNVIIIPKSTNSDRIKQNFDVMDFKLTEEDMKRINALDIGKGGRILTGDV
ncbi:1,5-anhydro-D-fructose reductase [Nymphon striatum]|nr:1,5-anhydro-D-fructose reductase [Nymphon striatum]